MSTVTLQMIADRCGLSKSTVAYILREPLTAVAKESTRKLVLTTARSMGYQRNFAARALRTQKYKAIGILFPWTYGHYGELVMALDRAMKKHDYHGIYSFWEGEFFEIALQTLCNQGVDAIITAHDDAALLNCSLPVITYEDCIQGCDCVFCDKASCIRQIFTYLDAKQCRDIGYIGLQDARLTAILQEMEKRRIPMNPDWIISNASAATLPCGFHAMQQMIGNGRIPKVMIAHSDLVAQGILNACQGIIEIPRQMSIISFDNLSWSSLTQPPLTTFDRCYDETADLLIRTALERIAHPDLPPMMRQAPLKLIERKSLQL